MEINIPQHRALTGWLRQSNKSIPVFELKHLLSACLVSPYLGALPLPLRRCVHGGDIRSATELFRMALDEFLAANAKELKCDRTLKTYDMPDISALFETPCILECRNRAPNEFEYPWRGAIGFVYRLSFPEINARYALKIFRMDEYKAAHGPWYEIPNALRAYHAEPKDNIRMHMASLGDIKYMLSDWSDGPDVEYQVIRSNRNKMFETAEAEMHGSNYRDGRRIDFGKTYRTIYAAASYKVRKKYRQIINLADQMKHSDAEYAAQRINNFINSPRSIIEKREMDQAVQLINIYAPLRYVQLINSFGIGR